MKKVFVLLYMVFSILMVACSSLEKFDKKNIDIHQFDLIGLGQSKADVIKNIGKASDSKVKNHAELWFYKNSDEDTLQRGTIVLDTQNQNVSGVTVIPQENDKELKLEYLQKVKFSTLVFEKIPLKRCQRDYFPQEEFYINVAQGVIIEFNFQRQTVESYTRSSSQYALEFTEKIKNCKY